MIGVVVVEELSVAPSLIYEELFSKSVEREEKKERKWPRGNWRREEFFIFPSRVMRTKTKGRPLVVYSLAHIGAEVLLGRGT